MPDRPQVVLSGFGDEAANHKTAVEQFSALSAAGLQYYSLRFVDVGERREERDEAHQERNHQAPPPRRRIRHERRVDRLADRQSEAPRRRRRHVEPIRAVRQVPRKRSQPRLRAGPRVRNQADPRLLVLSAQGRRRPRTRCASRRPARANRRNVPPQRSNVRPGNRGQPRRPNRASSSPSCTAA